MAADGLLSLRSERLNKMCELVHKINLPHKILSSALLILIESKNNANKKVFSTNNYSGTLLPSTHLIICSPCYSGPLFALPTAHTFSYLIIKLLCGHPVNSAVMTTFVNPNLLSFYSVNMVTQTTYVHLSIYDCT